MPDWTRHVRANLKLRDVSPEQENEAVQEVARQLEDAYDDALARGLGEHEAENLAFSHISDWRTLAEQLQLTRRYRPRLFPEFASGMGKYPSYPSRPNWRRHMSILRQDLLYSLRLLLKQPGLTAIIVVSLALGIGANTMIFSLVDAFLLRPMPFAQPDRLTMVWSTPPEGVLPQANGRIPSTRGLCQMLLEQSRTLDVACYQNYPINLWQDDPNSPAPERLQGQEFIGELPRVLGVNPILGRWFTEDEARNVLANPVILISHEQWQRRFDGSPNVLGQKVRIDSAIATIVGVMPPGFHFFTPEAQYWVPFNLPASPNSQTRFLQIVGRLKGDYSLEQARAEMNTFATRLTEQFPTNKDWRIGLEPVREFQSSGLADSLLTFQGAVVLVLLIACANVAGLLLANGAAMSKELAVRTALGSSRWRIVRQFLTQSVLLALIGGTLGVFLGWAGLQLFLDKLPPLGPEVGLDLRVLTFTLFVSVLAGLIFGVLPALQVSRLPLVEALKENSRSASANRTQQRLRSVFVVVQISLAFVLLVGAGLLTKSFLQLNRVDVGFEPRDLMTFQLQFAKGEFFKTGPNLPSGLVTNDVNPRLNTLIEEIRERLATIRGVQSATGALTPPLAGGIFPIGFTIEGQQPTDSERETLRAEWNPVLADFFRTLGAPVLRGREFNSRDSQESQPVAVISEAMAKRFWPNEDPIGKRIQNALFRDVPREIIGVVGDVHYASRQDIRPQMYVPFTQLPLQQTGRGFRIVTFVVRSSMDPSDLVPAMRSAVAEVDRSQAVSQIQTIEDYAFDQLLRDWMYVTLLGIFGGIAVLLAVAGIYGIMAHSVNQRIGEIGVRMALGARSWDVLRLILQRGLLLTTIGLVIGFTASLTLTRLIQTVLWHVTPTDPLTFLISLVGLSLVATLACYIPARRALRINPVTALRNQ